jgi:glycosyltransferase involved in cell wall biosynthesis
MTTVLWVCGARIVGGAERAALHVLCCLRDRGHAIRALCPDGSDLAGALLEAGLDRRPVQRGSFLLFAMPCAIARACHHWAPDVVLVTTPNEWVWACITVRRGSKVVLVRHMTLPLARPIGWVVNRRADAVVAVSEAVRRSLVTHAGVRPDLVHVVRNPVRFPPRANVPTLDERRHARTALGLEPGGYWVGFFGGLDPLKGIADVLQSIRAGNDEIGPIHLLACGRARSTEVLTTQDMVRCHGMADRFHYLGVIDRVEEALVASNAIVVATHSRLGEAAPLAITEAMACGTPVVAYATGGIPELLGEDGHAGRLAPADDVKALSRLLVETLADVPAAERMATNALHRVARLCDPEESANQYERLFQELCAGARR